MSDIVEEAKEFHKSWDVKKEYGKTLLWSRFKKALDFIERLIAEMERLRFVQNSEFEREAWFNKRLKHEENLKEQIESLIKERDELKNWGLRQEFDERGHTIQKLEAENAERKTDNELLEHRLANVLKELAASKKALEGMTRQASYNATNMNNSAKDRNKERERAVLAEERLRVSEKARLEAEEKLFNLKNKSLPPSSNSLGFGRVG